MKGRRQHDANDTLATIPWKWRDWRASKARAVMTPEARGVYRELLDASWGEPGCALPNDDETLAGLAGVTREYWLTVRAQVLAWFDEKDGKLTNPRALYEWKKARGFRSAKRKAGRDGAKARWDKAKAEQGTTINEDSTAIPLPVAKHASPSSVIRQPSSVVPSPEYVGTEEHSRPPTSATPAEARAVALEALGPPDPPREIPPDEKAELDIRAQGVVLVRRLYTAVGRLSERTGQDSMAVMRTVTAYKREDGTEIKGRSNPAGLTAERLEKSVEDAEGWLADLEKQAS